MKSLFSQPKPGYLARRTRKNAFLMLFWAVLFFVVYIFYVRSAAIYVKNAMTDGVELDASALLAAVEPTAVAEQTAPFDYDSFGATVPESLNIDKIYKQGDYYRFMAPIEKVEYTDIGYYLSDSNILRIFRGDDAGFERQGEIVQRLAMVTIEGQKFVSLIPYGATINEGSLATCAVFSEQVAEAYAFWDIGLTEHAGSEVANFLLDLRDIPVESEGNDLIMLVIFSILFPLFLIYALLAFIFPRLHMNYLLTSRSWDPDEVSAQIEYELQQEGVRKQSRQIYTENFIIKETLHSTRIMKNHLKRH